MSILRYVNSAMAYTISQNQSKYFKVKRHIKRNLLHSMNISDTSGEFHVNFEPDPKQYTHHMLLAGGTGSGKTHFAREMILRNLDGPKRSRRHFLIISSEWNEDSTLKPLKKESTDNLSRVLTSRKTV